MSNKLWLKQEGKWSSINSGSSDSINPEDIETSVQSYFEANKDIFKGTNGVSGFLPDYEKRFLLSISSHVDKWGANGLITEASPDDGYLNIYIVGNASAYYSYGCINPDTYDKATANGVYCSCQLPNLQSNTGVVYTMPIKRGYLGYAVATGGLILSKCDVRFVPIYKPELTDEIVVSYLNGKPVYEKLIICQTPSTATVDNIYDCSDMNIERCLSIDGNIYVHKENSHYHLPINSFRYGSNDMNIDTHYQDSMKTIRMQVNNSFYCNIEALITMKYTKTTD